jgi:hypothetical protein
LATSYNNYKLANLSYPDKIENIIYNKEKMRAILEKKKKEVGKLLKKRVIGLKSKTFIKFIVSEIGNK